jgi:uncharacterized iron-regulated membrane protein
LIRRATFVIHQWAGFILGAYVIAIFLTGALLILYENRIPYFSDDPMVRLHAAGNQLPLQTLVQKVQLAYPGLPITEINQSCAHGCSLDFQSRPNPYKWWNILVDPYTGKVLSKTIWQHSIIGWLYTFHAQLFGGSIGALVNYVLGGLVLVLAVTGLYLWPGWQKLSRGFTIRWKGDAWRINFDLHKVVGIASFVFIGFIAFTGVMGMVLPAPAEPALTDGQATGKPLPLDLLLSNARRTLQGRVSVIYPPLTPESALKVRFVVPGDPDPWGWSYVEVDRYSGKVLKVQDINQSSVYDRFWIFLYPLHTGGIGGLVLRYLYCVLALLPIALYFTGWMMWLNRLKREELIQTRRGSAIVRHAVRTI